MRGIKSLILTVLFLALIIVGISLFLLIDFKENFSYFLVYYILALIILFIISFIFFCKYVNYYPRPERGIYNTKFNVYNAIKLENNIKYIDFTLNDNGFFICETKNLSKLKLDLRGFIFKKNYIRSYVVRNLRYQTVSNKLKFNRLFNCKLKISKIDNLILRINIKNKKFLYCVVNEYISRYSLICKLINELKYYSFLISLVPPRIHKPIFLEVITINEELFSKGKIR